MYGYERIIDWIALRNLQMRGEHWFLTEVFVFSTLIQLCVIALGLFFAFIVSKPLHTRLNTYLSRLQRSERTLRMISGVLRSLIFPALAVVFLSIGIAIAAALGWPYLLLTTAVNLLAVWIIIRVTSRVIDNETVARLIALAAFALATLNILDLLQPTILLLDSVGIRIGDVYLTVLEVLKGAVQLAVLLWIAMTASRIAEQRIQRVNSLTPSIQVLFGKLLRTTLIAIAFVIALGSIGIDLTAFAVFTGAVGVGVGFGLQKLVSNLISGVILLLDRSIKPGDIIEVGDTFGWVSALNARYASVTTRDGKEWLIPNEDLITQQVTNWSFSNRKLRLLMPFGISYDSDVRTAMTIAVESAKDVSRVLRSPEPVCRLMGFGESSVDLELRIWITDPANGVVNVQSEVLLNMWDRFHAEGIKIPFAQRDLHVKSGTELNVRIRRDGARATV